MSDRNNKLQNALFPLLILLIVLLLMLINWLWLKDMDDRGTFGDMFGGINALFSGLAFAGVIYAILLQRRDLELQRAELRGQREQMEAHNRALLKQNFESTFFQLLRLHTEITRAVDITNVNPPIIGRECFEKFDQEFRNDYRQTPPTLSAEARVDAAYDAFYEAWQSDVGHYFRSLYNLIKFVHRSDEADKRFYTSLVRAQLSTYELTMIFYNCISHKGREHFKPLVNEYGLLKSMPPALIVDRDLLMTHYEARAFQ
jgi:hypothetical protein